MHTSKSIGSVHPVSNGATEHQDRYSHEKAIDGHQSQLLLGQVHQVQPKRKVPHAVALFQTLQNGIKTQNLAMFTGKLLSWTGTS